MHSDLTIFPNMVQLHRRRRQAVQEALQQLQWLTLRAARDAPLERFVRDTNPLHSGRLARALLDVLPTSTKYQCAATDVLGTVRHTMLVLGERRKWHEIGVGGVISIRASATVRVWHAV
jgi:hypothetical protein